jgi:hypothetical protein
LDRLEPTYEDFFVNFPKAYEVKNGNNQWWQHEPGSEYLVANPIDFPSLQSLFESCRRASSYDVDREYFTCGLQMKEIS